MSEQGNQNPPTQTNLLPESAPAPTTFRERKLQQMASERRLDVVEDRITNLQQVETPQREPQRDAHQPDFQQEPEPQLSPTEGEPPGYPEETGAPTGDLVEPGVEITPTPDVDSPPQEAVDWQAKFNEAEEMRGNMQSDYQRKTQKIADDRRELKHSFEVQRQVAEAYVQQSDRNLAQWQGVDWQQLRRTLDPADYNARVAQFQQVGNQADQAKQNHQALINFAEKALDEQKQSEAEVSRDILKNTIPKWGNELYGSLRNYAVDQLGYSAIEFDEVTDHKTISLIHRDYMTSNAGRTVEQVTRQTNQRPPQGANLPQRGHDGKFRNTKQAWLENPGQRGRAHDHFTEKLRREREGR